MRRELGRALVITAVVSVLALRYLAGGAASGSSSPTAQAGARATAVGPPAAVAVRLLAALAGGDPRTGAVVVDATATPAFADQLREVWRNAVAARRHRRQRLTVTNLAARVDGRSADVHLVGQLAVSEPGTAPVVVAVAWRCSLVEESDLGWRVTAVS